MSEATGILRRLRAGENAEVILERLQRQSDMAMPLQLQDVSLSRRRGYQLGDIIEFPAPLQTPQNVYLSSLAFKSRFTEARLAQLSPHAQEERALSSPEHLHMYEMPYHTVRLANPKLEEAKPSLWTNVMSDDSFLCRLLENYFLFEYPHFACFHMDHFLDDMIRGDHHFCSPLLVNAVLASACVRRYLYVLVLCHALVF